MSKIIAPVRYRNVFGFSLTGGLPFSSAFSSRMLRSPKHEKHPSLTNWAHRSLRRPSSPASLRETRIIREDGTGPFVWQVQRRLSLLPAMFRNRISGISPHTHFHRQPPPSTRRGVAVEQTSLPDRPALFGPDQQPL